MIYIVVIFTFLSVVASVLAFKYNLYLSQAIKEFPNKPHKKLFYLVILNIVIGFILFGQALYLYFVYIYIS